MPKPEGEGFPGLAIAGFAALGLAWGARQGLRRASLASTRPWQQGVLGLGVVALAAVAGLLGVLFLHGASTFPGPFGMIVIRGADRLLVLFAAIALTLVALVPTARQFVAGAGSSAASFYGCALAMAALLALGPQMHAAGRVIGTGPYNWLWHLVPGFDGLRVPARYLMLVALFLAVLAGLGAAAVLAWRRPVGVALAVAGSLLILAEGWISPIALGTPVDAGSYEPAPQVLRTGRTISPLYHWIRAAPAGTVLIEFPIGEPAYDIQATFYAGYHRKPLVNGYSGFFSDSYVRRSSLLSHRRSDPAGAAQALRDSGATHAIVHERAYPGGDGPALSAWLLSLGARMVAADGDDKLFVLRPGS